MKRAQADRAAPGRAVFATSNYSDWTARAIRGKNVAISGEAQTPLLEPV